MTTTCATSVLGVCGWSLAPSAAHPASVAHVSNSFTWLGSVCAVRRVGLCGRHYHTLGAAPEPQHTPYVRAERAWADRTAYILLIRKRPRYPERKSAIGLRVCAHVALPRWRFASSRSHAAMRSVAAVGTCRAHSGCPIRLACLCHQTPACTVEAAAVCAS
jgi:hypothetical protein